MACLSIASVGCTGDAGDDDGGSSTDESGDESGDGDGDGDANPCDEEQIRIWGTLDGSAIDRTAAATGHSVALDTTTVSGEGLSLRIESADGWAFGGTVDARFVITGLDMAGLQDPGNCFDDGFPGTRTVDDDGDGAIFSVGMLHEGPPDDPLDPTPGYCATPAIQGQLEGCFRWPE